jgi:hypothetical protein
MGIFNDAGVMASAVPVARNPVVAPIPATMSPGLRAARQRSMPTVAPVSAVGGEAAQVAPSMEAVLAAQQAYRETSNPFDAALQGWTIGAETRHQREDEQAKKDQVAAVLQKHPDLSQFVRSNVMEPADAIRIAGDREANTTKTAADAARKDQISAYLTELSGSDERYAKIAKQWAAGVLDEDGVANALEGIDKVPELTPDQKTLKQINEEREAKGEPKLSMEEFLKPAEKAPDTFGNEKDLYQQYASSDPVKTYEVVKTSFERVKESAAQQSGAGDLGLVYGYMRMLDPGSVVRESEFAMAAQAGDFGEQVAGAITRLLNGQRLPESQRQEFARSAEALYRETAGNLADINKQFTERAKAAGVDPTRFLREPETYETAGAPAADAEPASDDVEDLVKKYGF